jgi:hypothetical protein
MRGAWPQSSLVGTVTDRIRYLTDSINFPLTKSRCMHKDEGKPGQKQQTSSVGWWYVTLSPCRSPRGALLVVCRCARYLTESIKFPRTKSQRKLGRMVARSTQPMLGRMGVRNTQAMPLTSRPAASRAPLRSLPAPPFTLSFAQNVPKILD